MRAVRRAYSESDVVTCYRRVLMTDKENWRPQGVFG